MQRQRRFDGFAFGPGTGFVNRDAGILLPAHGRHIRKSAAPIGFSAVDFLVIPEISQAIFPT